MVRKPLRRATNGKILNPSGVATYAAQRKKVTGFATTSYSSFEICRHNRGMRLCDRRLCDQTGDGLPSAQGNDGGRGLLSVRMMARRGDSGPTDSLNRNRSEMRNRQMLDKKSLNDRSAQVMFAPGNKVSSSAGKRSLSRRETAGFPGEAGNDFPRQGAHRQGEEQQEAQLWTRQHRAGSVARQTATMAT